MSSAPTVGNIISGIALIGSLLSAGFAGWQASIARDQKDIAIEQTNIARDQTKLILQQTVSAQEAAKRSSKALCQTLETGLNVVDLSRVTFLGGFTSPLTGEQQTDYKNKLEAQEMFLKDLSADNNCPPRTGQ